VRPEGLGELKKKLNVLIRSRTRDLPACSILPEPTTLPRAPISILINKYIYDVSLHLLSQHYVYFTILYKHSVAIAGVDLRHIYICNTFATGCYTQE
jgi:hypothetical protein